MNNLDRNLDVLNRILKRLNNLELLLLMEDVGSIGVLQMEHNFRLL